METWNKWKTCNHIFATVAKVSDFGVIYQDECTECGCIGVLADKPNEQGLYQNLNVERNSQMSKNKLYATATKAMEVAKKNSLKRKQRTEKILYARCLEKIADMVEDGVVSVVVPMTEEEQYWGLAGAQAELEAGGFKVILEKQNEDDEDETPDLIVSIEHLK